MCNVTCAMIGPVLPNRDREPGGVTGFAVLKAVDEFSARIVRREEGSGQRKERRPRKCSGTGAKRRAIVISSGRSMVRR